MKFRTEMERKYPNAETRSQVYGSLTAALTATAREAKDAEQLRHAREVLNVLYVRRDEQRKEPDPNPIKVADFRDLVAGADAQLRAVLLLSLNACLYLSEVLAVEWTELDLDRKTFASSREKTGVKRAAVLWDETVEALRALSRRGQSPFVFTSGHGTKFNTNSYRMKFNRLRKACGVNVEFNQIRDGSYSAACGAGVDFALCQILAGHKLPGQADHYVARVPKKTAPACDAVHTEYAPFPTSKGGAVKIGRPRKVNAKRSEKTAA